MECCERLEIHSTRVIPFYRRVWLRPYRHARNTQTSKPQSNPKLGKKLHKSHTHGCGRSLAAIAAMTALH